LTRPAEAPAERPGEAPAERPGENGLDVEACERARQARDPRFDGRFFIGVRTTGVYCRPICPVRQPKAENVRFFASAAGAAEAGFRPCLRCRPESSPGTWAWQGTAATVSRALRLIQEGALDEGSVDELAGRLGIGPRHLGRLFLRHVGAPPLRVAQTRRLHLAKKLLDETSLKVTEIAYASGFGSVRRFHEALRGAYGRPPGEIRRGRGEAPARAGAGAGAGAGARAGAGAGAGTGAGAGAGEGIRLRLAFRPPFDWEALRAFFALRAVPGVEAADGESYRRTIAIDGRLGRISVRAVPGAHHLDLAVELPDLAAALVRVLARVRRMFDLDADPLTIERDLGRDAALAKLLRARPGLRVPGAWDGFELAVRAVLGQQVSVKGARTLAGRLAERFGARLPVDAGDVPSLAFPTPEALADADLESVGLPAARAATIRRLARSVLDGALDLEASRDLETSLAELGRLEGIGPWTAHYVALRALGEPDAFPASDLGLLGGASLQLAPRGERFTPASLERRAEAWRPWRAYAAMHLWQAYAEGGAAASRRPSRSARREGLARTSRRPDARVPGQLATTLRDTR
jgi:AraC family transcriptional regulator of adaptative response / DNA-3-methyladenine glycosylase II